MDGNKQRYNIYKDELLLLSIFFMGALFACLMIDAKENIDVAIFDITWVFYNQRYQRNKIKYHLN